MSEVNGGVDTHRDVHVAAVVDSTGRVLGTQTGYEQLGDWPRVVRVGVRAPAATAPVWPHLTERRWK